MGLPVTIPSEVVAAYEDALRTVAAATVKARRLAGADLLVQCEHSLSSLIVLGAVPTPPIALRPAPDTHITGDRGTLYWREHSDWLDGGPDA